MLKLMKYELLRRKQLLIGGALTMLFVEGIALYGIYRGGDWNMLAIIMTMLLCIGGILLPMLDTVVQFYSDYKQKHGYMLFMTPQSGYRIVWSKVLFAIMELLAAAAILGGCIILSGAMVNHLQDGAITDILKSLQREISPQIDISFSNMLFGYGSLLGLQILAQLSIAVLALSVSRIMLPRNSYNWLIALVMYFALALVVNVVDSGVLLLFGIIRDMHQLTNNMDLVSGVMGKYFIIGAVTYFLWFVGCTSLSGFLVNKGVDL